jgi:hypothetical protein
MWLILLSKISLLLNLIKDTSIFYSKDSKYALTFSLALVVADLVAIL